MERADGASSTTTVSAEGRVEAEVTLPAAVVAAAAESGEAAALPLPALPVTADRETAPAVTVSLPGSAAARVEIPVEGATPGVVVLLVAADGTETILKGHRHRRNRRGCHPEERRHGEDRGQHQDIL